MVSDFKVFVCNIATVVIDFNFINGKTDVYETPFAVFQTFLKILMSNP